MSRRRWHAPQGILVIVLGIAVLGTLLVGLLLGSTPGTSSSGTANPSAVTEAGERPVPQSPGAVAALPTEVEQMPAVVIGTSREGFQQRTLLLMVRGSDGLVSN